MPRRTSDPEYRRRRERLKALRLPCHLCGRSIDYDLPPTDKWSFTADHEEPYSTGGSNVGKLLASHRSCNSRRGNKPLGEATRSQDAHIWAW